MKLTKVDEISPPVLTLVVGAKRQRQVKNIVGTPALDHSSTPVVSRPARPSALDFWDSPTTPSAATPKIAKGRGKKAAVKEPPVTPAVPWDMYGIDDTSVKASDAKATDPTEQGKKSKGKPTKKKKAQKPIMGISQQHGTLNSENQIQTTTISQELDESDEEQDAHDKEMDEEYIPVGPGPLPRVPKRLKRPKKRQNKAGSAKVAAETETEDALDSAAADTEPHTPAKPKRRKAAPPPPALPLPGPSHQLSSEPEPEYPPEANPSIWNLGRKTTLRHKKRDAPARPGNVYCEVCFRGDCARWTRVRDGVIKILRLVGGDSALEELRELAQVVEEAEEAEEETISYQHTLRQQGRTRKRLKSPPPPVRQLESDSDETDDDWGSFAKIKGRVPAKKIIILPNGDTVETRSLQDSPSDVAGLVLLRILVEQHMPDLHRTQRAEANRVIEALRKDIGLSVKQLGTLSAGCRALLVSFRRGTSKSLRQRTGQRNASWWWEFDQALRDAHRQQPAEALPSPSAFATVLAKKAKEAEVALATMASKAQDQGFSSLDCTDTKIQDLPDVRPENLAQLERALGCNIPSDVFLKRIGERLGHAIWTLTRFPSHRTAKKHPYDEHDLAITPSPKRRKPTSSFFTTHSSFQDQPPHRHPVPLPCINTTTTTASFTPTSILKSNPPSPPTSSSPSSTPLPLPCLYCAESGASLRRAAERPFPRGSNKRGKKNRRNELIGHGASRDRDIFSGAEEERGEEDNETQPWVKPLMWTFGYSYGEAVRVGTVLEFVEVIRRGRGGRVGVVEVGRGEEGDQEEGGGGAIKFLVDVVGVKETEDDEDGGEERGVRIVLIEMKSVFETIWEWKSRDDKRGRRVRFEAPVAVGVWEKWREGELEGSRYL